jgi:site-specific recombinase XerD
MEKQVATDLRTLIADALKHLEGLDYSLGMLGKHRSTWRSFRQFAREFELGDGFCIEMVRQFLKHRGIEESAPGRQLRSYQRDVIAAMRILTEYALHGCFQRRRCVAEKVKLSPNMEAALVSFERFSKTGLGLARRTLCNRGRYITMFLHFLDANGVKSLAEVNSLIISDFAASRAHLRPNSLAREMSHLRSFLRHLFMQGLASETLIEHVPKVRVWKDERIPSVWKQDDVNALLAAVDRSSPHGKRDYAVLLLAARLGLRVGEIRSLRLEHLHWDEDRIEFRQPKTGTPVSLPLTDEIGTALIDYLKHGRPSTHYREVFLKIHAPIEPFGRDNTLHYIITTYRRRAGIALPAQSRCGLHSLRHTVASRLLEVGTSLETISSFLGHMSLESTRVYTKVDIETLRSAALDPDEVDHAKR